MDKLISSIKKEQKFADPKPNSHYIFENEEGLIMPHPCDVCFYRFKAVKMKDARLVISQHKREKYVLDAAKQKQLIKYMLWVINKSPWKKAFIFNSKWLEKGIKLNVNESSTFLVSAMTAVREGWEYPQFIDMFNSFIKKGVSPELSYVICHFYDTDGNRRSYMSGHGTFYEYYINKNSIKLFKQAKPVTNKKPAKEYAKDYSGIHTLFYDGKSDNLFYDLKKFSITKQGPWGDVSTKLDFKNPELYTYLKELDNETNP